MKTVTINLYQFDKLSKEAQKKAIEAHAIFLNEIDAPGREYEREEVIDSIEANEYLFFNDGELASCTTYTDGHPKAGTTEFHFHGTTQLIDLNKTDSTALSVAIGYETGQLLNLKYNKAGHTKTSWGTKSVEGLGKCIQRIVEEQTARVRTE